MTSRELGILRLLAAGSTNPEIAGQLWITRQTVKFHVANIYRKLDVSNRTEACHYAHVNGMMAVAPPGKRPRSPPVLVTFTRSRVGSMRASSRMAVRVGIDLVAVEAVRDAMREHGDRYLKRIYTEAEMRECRTAQSMIPERLAARFAAKEATMKVLRPAEEAIPWRNIEVVRHPFRMGRTASSAAPPRALAADQGLGDFALSVSHEAGLCHGRGGRRTET